MADGLFNYQDPQMLRDAYTQQFVPKDDLSLQQIMVGAAAGMGTGLGRLFGGKAPQEAENELMKDIFGQAAQATTDPIERMTLAAQGLRKAGMEGRAVQLEQEIAKMSTQMAAAQSAQAKANTDTAAAQAEQQRAQGAMQFVKRKLPELTDIEAQAIAADKEAVRKLLSDPAMKTQVVESNGRSLLINSNTGETIKDLGTAPERGTRVNVGVSPQIKQAPDIVGAISAFDKATEAQQNMLADAARAKTMINEASRSSNSQTWEAARTTLAKAVGEGKLSNEDIRRTGVDPRLVQGALDWVNKKVEGVPNQDIMKQLFALATVLEQSASAKINKQSARAQAAAQAAGFPGDPNLYFPRADTPAPAASGGKVVDFNSLK